MCKVAMLAPLSFALLLLACGKSDPVADNAVGPPDELVGDASASGLAAPANAAAAEAVRQAALPPASGGLTWSFRAADHTALFGPAATPAFSIQCQRQREGPSQLIFIRFLPPAAGGQATLSFTGNGQVASVPVAAVSDPSGTSGHWRAVVAPGDIARDVAETFAGQGPVNVSVSGLPSLVVPSADGPRRVFRECLGN
jgi:hypothetical protein